MLNGHAAGSPEKADQHCQSSEIGIPDELARAMDRKREVRAFCCRLAGWAEELAGSVDDMVHTLLTAAERGTPIALRGESDLVPVAHALHRRLFGAELPFVVCDPRRHEGDGSVRSPPNRRTALLALDAAMGGSVCIRSHRLPPDFEALLALVREPRSAMLFVCLHGSDPIRDLLCSPIEVPSLAERAADLERLLDECLKEAADAIGVEQVRLPEHMREAVLRHVESLADLEKTALRVVAIASSRNVSQAAGRLRIAPVSLSRWLSRRRWSKALLSEAVSALVAPTISSSGEAHGPSADDVRADLDRDSACDSGMECAEDALGERRASPAQCFPDVDGGNT
jgi:hypothetical protein